MPSPEKAVSHEERKTVMIDDKRTLPWLKTSQNTIVTEDGQEVILRGANIMRAEWDWSMDWENRAIPELAADWHGNVLTRGFASDPVNNGDAEYLGLLDDLVSLAEQNRMYLILAWRSFEINGDQPAMPNHDAQNALVTLAARYKGRSHVIYALQVEPHDDEEHEIVVSWTTLRPLFEDMVDAIRSVAVPFEPLVMIPGTDWSRDLSGAITDPVNRPNVVYNTHPYNPESDFQRLFGAVFDAGLPVFVGEFAPSIQEDTNMTMNDVSGLLAFTRERRIGWAAWLLDYQASALMNKADLSPTIPYGAMVQTEMQTTPPI
jgi:Cellulase (glycosyl hydrolase family 5)